MFGFFLLGGLSNLIGTIHDRRLSATKRNILVPYYTVGLGDGQKVTPPQLLGGSALSGVIHTHRLISDLSTIYTLIQTVLAPSFLKQYFSVFSQILSLVLFAQSRGCLKLILGGNPLDTGKLHSKQF